MEVVSFYQTNTLHYGLRVSTHFGLEVSRQFGIQNYNQEICNTQKEFLNYTSFLWIVFIARPFQNPYSSNPGFRHYSPQLISFRLSLYCLH